MPFWLWGMTTAKLQGFSPSFKKHFGRATVCGKLLAQVFLKVSFRTIMCRGAHTNHFLLISHESRKGLLQAYKAQSPFVHMTPIQVSSIPSLPSYQHHLANLVILFSLPLLPATLFIMKYHSQKKKKIKKKKCLVIMFVCLQLPSQYCVHFMSVFPASSLTYSGDWEDSKNVGKECWTFSVFHLH